MVRRVGRGLDQLHAVLPDGAAGRLCLRALAERAGRRRQTIVHLALLALSFLSLPILPSAWWKPQGAEDPLLRILGLAGGDRGAALFSAVIDQSAAAIVVFAIEWRRDAVPVLRAFERGLDAGPADLSGAGRTVPDRAASRPGCGRSPMWLSCWSAAWSRGALATRGSEPGRVCRCGTAPARAAVVRTAGLDGSRGVRLGAAARGDKPPDAEYRRRFRSFGCFR